MHVAEGFLPPVQAAAWTAASAPFVVHGARQVSRMYREEPDRRMLLTAAGAYTFFLSALKVPSATGSSSHATGVALGTILFRPPVMALLGTIVLVFQALLLAHGGLTTLGANVFSMAVAGPWAAWIAHRGVWRVTASVWWAAFVAAVVANMVTYAVTAVQLGLAFPKDGSVLHGAMTFVAVFGPTQVPLGITEGLLTASVITWLGGTVPQRTINMESPV